MAARAPLRPRDALRLLDAAFEVVVSAPAVSWTAILGGIPVAVACMVLVYDASAHVAGWDVLVDLAAVTAALGLFRYVAGGAAVSLVLAEIEGEPIPAGRALARAARRAPSLMAAGGFAFLGVAVSMIGFGLPLLGWGGVFLSVPLVVSRAGPPWRPISGTRALLGIHAGRTVGLTLLWLLGILFLAANVAGVILLLLYLAGHLLDVDVAYLESVLSPGNPIFFPATLAVAFVLLEPVRWASLTLLLVDGRVRRDGLDLQAAAAALPHVPSLRRRGASGLVLLLGLGLAIPGLARAQVPAKFARSAPARLVADARWAASEGAPVDPKLVARAVAGSPQAEGPALEALAASVEADLGAGHPLAAGRRLDLALGPLAAAGPGAKHPARGLDPKALARRILSEPAFQSVAVEVHHTKAKKEKTPGWVERFFRWLRKELRKLFDHPNKHAHTPTPSSVGLAWLKWVGWGVALVGLFAFVAFLVVRTLGDGGRRGETEGDDETSEPVAAPRPGTALADALAHSPDAWLARADAAAAGGAYREAVRLGYLALLAALHRSQAIDYAKARTNWDLVRGFRGEGLARETFEDVTRRYENAWYGMGAVTDGGYQIVRTSAANILHSVGGIGLG